MVNKGTLFIAAISLCALAPVKAHAYVFPWIYELTPAAPSGYTASYSVALGVSPDASCVVGVSSNDPITISAGKIITVATGQHLFPTVWNTSSLPSGTGGPIAGTNPTELPYATYGNVALYAAYVNTSGYTYVGTEFPTTTTSTGIIDEDGAAIVPFTAAGTNSYGLGIGTEGLLATGWASFSGTNKACAYIITPPVSSGGVVATGGLVALSSSAGFAYSASSFGTLGTSTYYMAGVGGAAGGDPAMWSITYSRVGKTGTWTGPTVTNYTGLPSSSGAVYAVQSSFDPQNVAPNNYALGGYSTSTDGFLFDVPESSTSGTYSSIDLGIPYAIIDTSDYVGTNSTGAYSSNEYTTYGSLYAWLDGYHWGAITPGGTYPYQCSGIGNWTSLTNAFSEAYIDSAFYFTVGNGVTSSSAPYNASTSGIAYLAIYEAATP